MIETATTPAPKPSRRQQREKSTTAAERVLTLEAELAELRAERDDFTDGLPEWRAVVARDPSDTEARRTIAKAEARVDTIERRIASLEPILSVARADAEAEQRSEQAARDREFREEAAKLEQDRDRLVPRVAAVLRRAVDELDALEALTSAIRDRAADLRARAAKAGSRPPGPSVPALRDRIAITPYLRPKVPLSEVIQAMTDAANSAEWATPPALRAPNPDEEPQAPAAPNPDEEP